jgi:hypothetical protein
MKKIITFLISVILILNYVSLSANSHIYSENEQQFFTNVYIVNEPCNFKFALFSTVGVGWMPIEGIEITVDGIDYGFVNLPFGVGNDYAEEIVSLPSGEVQLFWIGMFRSFYHFEVYNSLDELIYAPTEDLLEGWFFTYQNECSNTIECLPITDFEGVYTTEEHRVNLSWKAPASDDLLGFDIFRNDSLIDHLPPSTVSYSENTAQLDEGDYKYCVVPVYPSVCALDDECFEIHINVGIKNYKDNIIICPNPASHFITISGDRVSEVKMYNNIGQLVLNQKNTNTINVSALQNGIYVLSIETSIGHIIQKKIVIKK